MVLVTGATGILGRVIVLELLKRGKIVRAAKRRSSNLEEVRHSFQFYTENPEAFFDRIKWVDVDFDNMFSLENALRGIEEVYHCAATVSFHPADQRRCKDLEAERGPSCRSADRSDHGCINGAGQSDQFSADHVGDQLCPNNIHSGQFGCVNIAAYRIYFPADIEIFHQNTAGGCDDCKYPNWDRNTTDSALAQCIEVFWKNLQ